MSQEGNMDHIYSETPEDNGWGHLMKNAKEKLPEIVIGALEDLDRNKAKKKIIEDEIGFATGKGWNELLDLTNMPETAKALGNLLAFWDIPNSADQPKTDEDHHKEAAVFATLLRDCK